MAEKGKGKVTPFAEGLAFRHCTDSMASRPTRCFFAAPPRCGCGSRLDDVAPRLPTWTPARREGPTVDLGGNCVRKRRSGGYLLGEGRGVGVSTVRSVSRHHRMLISFYHVMQKLENLKIIKKGKMTTTQIFLPSPCDWMEKKMILVMKGNVAVSNS